nr:hypothetical protein CFP56_71443 [Quercus suber]
MAWICAADSYLSQPSGDSRWTRLSSSSRIPVKTAGALVPLNHLHYLVARDALITACIALKPCQWPTISLATTPVFHSDSLSHQSTPSSCM